MSKIEIYSSDYCPFCERAKALFQRKGLKYTEYDVGANPALREEMVTRNPGARTIPQIFIDDQPIGGFDGLEALDKSGELQDLT